MPDFLGDILAGFGYSTPSPVGTVVSGTVSGAGQGALSTGAAWGAAVGAIAGGIGSFFDYKAAKEAAKAATELAETQLEIVNIASKAAPKAPATVTTPGYYYPTVQPSFQPLASNAGAPGMTFSPQIPATAGATTVPTTVPTSTIGRAFPTPGDLGMATVLDPFLQALGLTNGGVTQPAGVATGTGGLPLPGQTAVGAISPAAPVTVKTVARPLSSLTYINPTTGQPMVYKYMGRPVLYSGDLAACRRVNRIAKRVSKSMPRRRRSP